MYEKAESIHPSYKNLNVPFIKCTCEKRSTGSMCTLYFIYLFIYFYDSWWVLKHYIPAPRIVFRRKGRSIYRRHCSIKPEWESGPWCIVEWVASIHHLHLSFFPCRNRVLYMQRCWTPSQWPAEEILWLQEFTCPSCVSVHMDPNGTKLFLWHFECELE